MQDFEAPSPDTREMQPPETRFENFRTIFSFTVICNGLTVLLFAMLFEWRSFHERREALEYAVIVLGLAGAVLIVASMRAYRRTLEPRIHLRLTPGVLTPGGDYAIEWECQGGERPFAQMEITLECREESIRAGGRGGTCKLTEVCYKTGWLNTEKPEEIARGKTSGRVPGRLMHSFDTRGGDSIVWLVRVKGTVRGWPGISDEYPVAMKPAGWKGAA